MTEALSLICYWLFIGAIWTGAVFLAVLSTALIVSSFRWRRRTPLELRILRRCRECGQCHHPISGCDPAGD